MRKLFLSLITMVCALAHANDAKQFTVVCLGDSITKGGYPEEMQKLLENARVINAGVGGNSSRDGLSRLQKDVLAHKPDVVVLFFGTNDGRVDAPKKHVPLAEYEKNLSTIVDRCQAIGAKVILGTMPPIDPEPYFTRHVKADFDAVGGLEKQIQEYRAAALRVGAAKKIPVVDLNQLLLNEKNWRSPDGVHPTEEGNKILAQLFAKEVKPLLGGTDSNETGSAAASAAVRRAPALNSTAQASAGSLGFDRAQESTARAQLTAPGGGRGPHIGVGAKPVPGAEMILDGSREMLDAKWTYWEGPRFSSSLPIKWKIVEDPVDQGTVVQTDDPAAAGGKYGAADIVTKKTYRDFRLHIEFLVNNPGGNSGVYLQNRYEIQILDGDKTSHGMGAVINHTESPYYAYNGRGKWNSYDINFRAARFKDGKLVEKAMVTMYFNGIKVHTNAFINRVVGGPNSGIDGGNDGGKGITDTPGGLKLQCEGHDVRYRNAWIKEINLEKADTNF